MKMAMMCKMRVLNEFGVLNVFFSLDVSQCQQRFCYLRILNLLHISFNFSESWDALVLQTCH